MTRRFALALLLALVTVSFVACATSSDGNRSTSKTTASTGPPPGTPLAKVKLGMNDAQVRRVLGDPTDSNAYMTGKAFIPFYFGPDTHRAEWIYEKMGRVVFSRNRWSGALKVIRVQYKPTETAGR